MSTDERDRDAPASKKPSDFRGSSRRLISSMRPDLPLISAVLALAVVSVGFSVVVPALLGRVTDLVASGLQGSGVDFTAIGRILTLAAAMVVLSALLTLIRGRLTARIALATAFRLREQATTKITRLPLGYFDRQPRGEVLSRVTNDIDNISQTLQQAVNRIVTSVLTLVGVLAMMFWISPLLTVVVILSVPASVLITMMIGKRAQPQFVRQWSATGRLNGHIEEMYTGHALVQVFGRQREALDTFDEHNQALYDSSFRAQFVSGVIEPALRFVGNLGYVLVAVIGGLGVISGSMTIGDVQAFIQYSQQFNQPISQIASMANLLQSGVASAERVFALLDAQEQDPDPIDAPTPAKVTGHVAFEDVSFRYEESTPLIEGLSLTVEPGQTVAIVGPTGAGKTTLVNLLMRFYEMTGGRITIDGVDISAMARADLRRDIGMVLQDTWLVGGTIAENIAYGVDHATREQIVEAAMATHVDRFVRTLPDGYDTVMDREGEGVSAGEKQLITIARAFLTEPPILILDEATSSVDTRTEVLIQHAMASLRTGRTSFVIAHRLSTIRDADVILVMESGRIVEQGDHETLLASGGAYARLYAAQFATSEVEPDLV
ncbi:ABC transporter ATP-binding protein [Actinoalloteichus hymeniacidonis]|uniref:Fatty acid ABC transporter ATP-binding/permease protein n=1 Tax=Actinoalloteichus hymeniacidonis TaxID=340345 RepID=A0AAC9HNT5_9PSEU|nr:ABC transporter ATP-binding protein [Actinoalloteichus hymeniacidonis]AOS62817.1 ABC-type multidrug transport system, ATPase and permease component [Actinoalloteichus hymeniacidonis]MBB5909152.1 ATP-binding cassette subfamily B protein [Actinoalloteichus hymeniacidonis]